MQVEKVKVLVSSLKVEDLSIKPEWADEILDGVVESRMQRMKVHILANIGETNPPTVIRPPNYSWVLDER